MKPNIFSMKVAEQLAKHLLDVHFGGNWTSVNMKDVLADVTWEQATKKAGSFNTILTLACHTGYYVQVATKVLQGGPLEGKDEDSFAVPVITSQEEWERLLANMWANVELFASLVAQLPDEQLWADFTDRKYGSYYRNIQGIIEHTHYHLGQMVMLKKLPA